MCVRACVGVHGTLERLRLCCGRLDAISVGINAGAARYLVSYCADLDPRIHDVATPFAAECMAQSRSHTHDMGCLFCYTSPASWSGPNSAPEIRPPPACERLPQTVLSSAPEGSTCICAAWASRARRKVPRQPLGGVSAAVAAAAAAAEPKIIVPGGTPGRRVLCAMDLGCAGATCFRCVHVFLCLRMRSFNSIGTTGAVRGEFIEIERERFELAFVGTIYSSLGLYTCICT